MTSLTDLYCKHADTVFPPGNVQDAIDEWAVRRIQKLEADNAALQHALLWYESKASSCRKIGIERDEARTMLDRDGGKRARRAIGSDHPGAALLRERDELRAEVERLREEVVRRVLEADELRGRKFVTTDETDWRIHVIDQPPADLPLAQIVEVVKRFGWAQDNSISVKHKAQKIRWQPGLEYRLAIGPSGLPLVSAEGLEPWARFVATDEDGEPLQFSSIPRHDTTTGHWCSAGVFRGVSALAPYTHARPGDWRDSLMEVQR